MHLLEATANDAVRVLDIRQESEFRAGHAPGALHIELGDLPGAIDRLTDVPTMVICGIGFTHVSVLAGSPQDWAQAYGQRLESGP